MTLLGPVPDAPEVMRMREPTTHTPWRCARSMASAIACRPTPGHTLAAVEREQRAAVERDADLLVDAQAALQQRIDIARDHAHAMRIVAAQVGLDEVGRDEVGLGLRRAAGAPRWRAPPRVSGAAWKVWVSVMGLFTVRGEWTVGGAPTRDRRGLHFECLRRAYLRFIQFDRFVLESRAVGRPHTPTLRDVPVIGAIALSNRAGRDFAPRPDRRGQCSESPSTIQDHHEPRQIPGRTRCRHCDLRESGPAGLRTTWSSTDRWTSRCRPAAMLQAVRRR